jgi:hypothetical protein
MGSVVDISEAKRRSNLKSGGGDGTFEGMETRVKALEDGMMEIKSDLKALLQSTAKIEGKIDGLPSAFEFGQLKGRVDSLPTFAKLSAIIGTFTAVIVFINSWSVIRAIFLKL